MLMLGPPPGGELSATRSLTAGAGVFDPSKLSPVTFDPTRPQLPATSVSFTPTTAKSASMLPWLLGAGVLAYLLFFRKKS